MASPGNQHCATCIGTLSFPIPGGVHLYMCQTAVSQKHCRLIGLRPVAKSSRNPQVGKPTRPYTTPPHCQSKAPVGLAECKQTSQR